MKKFLATLLMMAGIASAQAQTQVNVYGRISEYFENQRLGSTTTNQLTDDSSYIGFKGTEALGGGLNAFFVLETGVNVDAPGATTLGNRTAIVGLKNNFGSLSAGRDLHVIGAMIGKYDALWDSYGSSATTIHAAQGKRMQNAVFVTATPINGLTVSVQNGFSEVAGTASVKAGSIGYEAGGFSATVGRFTDVDNSSSSTMVGAKQKFDVTGTTVFGMWSDDEVLGVKTTGKSVGVNQELGKNLVALASYGTNDRTDAYNLGASYRFSKRTEAGIRYTREVTDGAADVRKVGVGLTHNF